MEFKRIFNSQELTYVELAKDPNPSQAPLPCHAVAVVDQDSKRCDKALSQCNLFVETARD